MPSAAAADPAARPTHRPGAVRFFFGAPPIADRKGAFLWPFPAVAPHPTPQRTIRAKEHTLHAATGQPQGGENGITIPPPDILNGSELTRTIALPGDRAQVRAVWRKQAQLIVGGDHHVAVGHAERGGNGSKLLLHVRFVATNTGER